MCRTCAVTLKCLVTWVVEFTGHRVVFLVEKREAPKQVPVTILFPAEMSGHRLRGTSAQEIAVPDPTSDTLGRR